MAAPEGRIRDQAEDVMSQLPEEHKRVLRILARRESMPFLALSSVAKVENERLGQIIDDLEKSGLVETTGRNSILDKIVTVRQRLAALTASAT